MRAGSRLTTQAAMPMSHESIFYGAERDSPPLRTPLCADERAVQQSTMSARRSMLMGMQL